MKENIAILGAGNLGISIAKGLVKQQALLPENTFLTKRNPKGMKDLIDLGFQVTSDNKAAVEQSKTIILCVQPKQLGVLIDEIKPVLTKDHTVVSVITGISLGQLKELVGDQSAIIRAMPNTAIAVGQSMTCLATDNHGSDLDAAIKLFEPLGKTLVIEEPMMQAATVLGASGIAFFMRYLRAATQGGVQMGFDSTDAQLIAMQTARGAAELVLSNSTHPEVEIDNVTTPQGCTIEGLNEMEHKGFSSALIQGIMASYYRITKMKQDNNGTL